MLVLTLAGVSMPLFVEYQAVWWDWVFIPLYIVQLAGLFGFVYSQRLAAPRLWQAVFVLSVAYGLWDLFTMTTETELAEQGEGFLFSMVAGLLLLQLPLFAALFLYGFRCKELWRGA